MPKYYIEVWASVGSCSAKEIVEVDMPAPPTDEQQHLEYKDAIGNIMDSGYALVDKDAYDKYMGSAHE